MFGYWYKTLVLILAAAAIAGCTPRDAQMLLRPPIPLIKALPNLKSLPVIVPDIKSIPVLKPGSVVVTTPPIVVNPEPAPRESDPRDEYERRDSRERHERYDEGHDRYDERHERYDEGHDRYDEGHDRYERHERQDKRETYERREHIPPGHLPPRGKCRIWYPDRPPGHQPPPGNCKRLKRHVPPGARLIYG